MRGREKGMALPGWVWLLTAVWLLLGANQPQRKTGKANTNTSAAQRTIPRLPTLIDEARWVDSIYQSMTPEERIGQLFMIRAHSNLGADHIRQVEDQIRRYHIGGLCFFQGTPARQLELTNQYQALVRRVPLMIAMDAEWGLGMRFKDSVVVYPRNLMLGAIEDNQLIYNYGRELARQLKRIGVHINFGPVVDINNNPLNPVINDRSFGEDKYNVVTKAYMYMIGLQDEGVMACAKHFPGHGDTQVDSHYDLPVITHDIKRLERQELLPFEILSDNGLQSIMVAHVHMPALDSTRNLPTTLSPAVVDTLLKQRIGFGGLIFTDALEMKGVTKHFSPGEIELKAFQAGNDILLLPEDLPRAFNRLLDAYKSGKLAEERIEYSVRKILRAKYKMGLTVFTPLSADKLYEEINDPQARIIKEDLISNALTLVRDSAQMIPLMPAPAERIAVISVGNDSINRFSEYIRDYWRADVFQTSLEPGTDEQNWLARQLQGYDKVITGLFASNRMPAKSYGISAAAIQLMQKIHQHPGAVTVVFGNPYSLRWFDSAPTIVMAYENDPDVHALAAQALFGARSFSGRLPVTASEKSKFLAGIDSRTTHRLRFGIPESYGFSTAVLSRIDTIAAEMIKIQASPGCQVLVIKDQAVIWQRSYGTHAYDSTRPVRNDDVYDLASITKVAATTLSLMKLYDDGLLDLDKTLGDYLPELKGSNKEGLVIRDVLAHRAGLYPWVPFYRKTLISGGIGAGKRLDPAIYSATPRSGFREIATGIYIDTAYWDQVWQQIRDSELLPTKEYRYSDLGFILFTRMIEKISGKTLSEFASEQFYKPLGLRNTGFHPLRFVAPSRLVPSEKDQYYRDQVLQGYVHDMAAAMLGGESGHAGLFSNAYELGVIATLLQNRGDYGGRRYLRPETVDLFTTRYGGETRRGLGFDLQQLDRTKGVNVTGLASSSTFGHTGFTGTCVWSDPECGITYVFLSNRSYPTMDNTKLNDYQYRLRIHYTIYKAME